MTFLFSLISCCSIMLKRQLMCLARVLLEKRKIIILDEASSRYDLSDNFVDFGCSDPLTAWIPRPSCAFEKFLKMI
jgi:ABC-type uncharacterized transport system YnjBCD ATPase subunit